MCLEKIIPLRQKCGIPNRKIIEIIRNLSGYFELIDQEKAFNRINHDYLFKTMEAVGIKGKFLKLTKTIYSEIASQIMINGTLTKKINIEKGVRQGCPLSMILYTIGSTPLIETINDEKEISKVK